jgi:valyl-tRNA synthetase
VRFSLVASAGQGSDVVLSEDRIAGYATFANKVWNAVRFVGMSLERAGADPWTPENLDEFEPLPNEATGEVPIEDRWIFSRLDEVAQLANDHTAKFRYHETANCLYQFFWREFCDWYIELKKLSFSEGAGLTNEWKNMLAALERALRLLHPVAPFITEELWQRLTENTSNRPRSIALTSYPQSRPGRRDLEAERAIGVLQDVVSAVRNLRAEMNIPPREALSGTLFSPDAAVRAVAETQADAFDRLASVKLLTVEGHAPEGSALLHNPDFDLAVELPEEQKKSLQGKLQKQLEQLEKAANGAKKQLGNDAFLAKAPQSVVDSIHSKLADYESQLERIRKTLAGL